MIDFVLSTSVHVIKLDPEELSLFRSVLCEINSVISILGDECRCLLRLTFIHVFRIDVFSDLEKIL